MTENNYTYSKVLHAEGKPNENYVSLPHHTRVATLHYTDIGAGDEHKRALMAIANQIEQGPKTLTNNDELGLCWRLLSYSLHSGEQSTCPPNYSIHNGSNDIVSTAQSGFQIIVNNFYNDHNDIIIYKVNIYNFDDNINSNNVEHEIIMVSLNPCFIINLGTFVGNEPNHTFYR